jgi:Outer membrane protein beta-barrel domain
MFMKSLFLTLFSLFTITILAAQTTIKPGVGLNFTDFSQDPVGGEFKAKVGWQIGGSVAFGKKFYIEPGLFYVGKSTEFQTTASGTPTLQENADINGIRIPLAVGVNLIGNEKTLVSLRGFGGASAFFLTSVGGDLDKDDFEKSNFGVFAGAGLDFWKLYLDLSYEWSLTNVQKDVSLIDVGKTRSLFITAGLRINL